MVQSLENIDKSKVYVDRIEGLDEVVSDVIGDTLTGAVSTITTSDLTAGKILVSDSNGKVAASNISSSSIPDDSNLVHKTGNETIAGTKTFSSTISGSINGNAATVTNGVYTNNNQTITGSKTFARAVDQSAASWTTMIPIKDTNTDFTVNPTYNKDYYLIQMNDKNGKLNSWITSQYSTNGESATYINVRARNTANTGNVDGSIGIIAKRDGTIVTKSHTPATADNSTQIATTAFVKAQGYAVNSGLVHTTGNESIGGIKKFTDKQKLGGNTIKSFTFARGTNPSSVQYANYYTVDSTENDGDNTALGLFRTQVDTEGQVTTLMRAFRNNVAGTNNSFDIRVVYPASHTPYATISLTPGVADNSTKIATTAYVNNKHQVVSTLPASPDANVFYYIPE